MQQRRGAGMMDVARLAGVSHQTVSRVLNDHPSVRETTRERVLAAMRELDYRPNRLARALVTSRSQLLGVITSGSAKWGPMSTLIAIEEAARASDYAVHVRTVRSAVADDGGARLAGVGDPVEVGAGARDGAADWAADGAAAGASEAAAVMADALIAFDTQPVDGVVVIAPRVSTVTALADISSRAPLLLVAAGVEPSERFDAVGVDQRAGARAATRHLIELGHRRIGHLAGPSDWFDALERRRGWQEELAAAGLPAGPVWEGDWTAEVGYAVGRSIAADPSRPTGLVVANDHMAMGVLRALGEAGLEVPGDVSVTGFDDIEGTGFLRPPLTTVRQDFEALAGVVMARLLPRLVPDGGGSGPGGGSGSGSGAGSDRAGLSGAGSGAGSAGAESGSESSPGSDETALPGVAAGSIVPELVIRASTAPPRH